MATIKVDVKYTYSKRMQELINLLDDRNVKIHVNQMIADAIEPYVPMDTGKLRRSLYVGPNVISWGRGLNYAHYQHEGEVYGVNVPITSGGTIVGWYSRPGVEKRPTGRELGVPGEWHGWRFGYTMPGTQHHWTEVYERQLKSDTNREITRYLKAECKRRGLDT